MLHKIKTFKTDLNGVPTPPLVPDPESTFFVCIEEKPPPVKPMKSREEVVDWIENCVLGDLRTTRLGIEEGFKGHTSARPLGGCNFFLAAGCCMALEYFAQVYGRGNDATSAAKHYVSDFLSKEDPRYSEIFWLLWSCFRNGIVHGSWPQAICVRGDEKNCIAVGANPHADGKHLQSNAGYPRPNLVISSAKFFLDLEASFDHRFRAWILKESDDDVLVRAAPRLLQINPHNENGLREIEVIRGWNEIF